MRPKKRFCAAENASARPRTDMRRQKRFAAAQKRPVCRGSDLQAREQIATLTNWSSPLIRMSRPAYANKDQFG
jgi:hypothetical protein